VLLVVPCYNESERLNLAAFKAFSALGHSICFADDGSVDGTADVLRKAFYGNTHIDIFRADVNQGKAAIIRSAVLDRLRRGLPPDIEWVGYWDADLATPLEEVDLFLRFRADFSPQAKAVFGSRILRLGAEIERSALRHYLGRAFATLAALMLNVRSYDSQCGAKLFHRSVLDKVFREDFISRWVFDLEILLRLEKDNDQVVECPVSRWKDIPGSKVKIFKEIFRVFGDLLKIRSRYLG
jgi:glycosyltransferase involved in cell wall biosynthesis